MAYDWKKFEPFQFWCSKVLPLIYDDSLSYYETLCKLYNLVTKLIELCNELIDAVKDIDGRVTVLEQTVDLLNQELVKLKTRMTNAETKIESLEDSVTSIQQSITNITSTLNEYGDRITTVEGDIATINSSIENINNMITSIGDRVTNVESSVKELVDNPYTLPIASSDKLGGIKVGNNLIIRPDGTLDAQAGGGGSDPDVVSYSFKVPCKVYDDEQHTHDPLFTENTWVYVYVKGNQIIVRSPYINLQYAEDSTTQATTPTFREMYFSGNLADCIDGASEGNGTLAELVSLLGTDKILGNELHVSFVRDGNVEDNSVDLQAIGYLNINTKDSDTTPTIALSFKGVIPTGYNGVTAGYVMSGFLAKGSVGGGSIGVLYPIETGIKTVTQSDQSEIDFNYVLYNDRSIDISFVVAKGSVEFNTLDESGYYTPSAAFDVILPFAMYKINSLSNDVSLYNYTYNADSSVPFYTIHITPYSIKQYTASGTFACGFKINGVKYN